MNKKVYIVLAICVISSVVTVCAPFFGMESITPAALIEGESQIKMDIFWKIRVPRVVSAYIAGAALALGGMAFQAMFRNPLATPFTLGVSSGAAFGASLYTLFGATFVLLGVTGQSLSAFVWALASIMIVYGLTRARKGFSTATMLIAGVAVNFLFSSMILFMQYISDFDNSFRIIRWMMGGFALTGYGAVKSVLPFVLPGILLVFLFADELNLLVLGEETALSRGVDVKRTRKILFFATSLMTGGIVAAFGPIGFVGMMAPHICRMMVGPNHRYLTPVTLMFGGMFLVVCDTFARILIAPAEIPVGVLTALLGGPFFLWLLMAGFSETGPGGRRRRSAGVKK
ncbi:MAG: iron ABC transporter permease [Candidatus Krumholzibacteria bacterium]|nr:iron ABC transporter permease [Candidatus Krumholzibacteria bacterium]